MIKNILVFRQMVFNVCICESRVETKGYFVASNASPHLKCHVAELPLRVELIWCINIRYTYESFCCIL